jgi:hypothetical protein
MAERRIARPLKVSPQTVAYQATDVAEVFPKEVKEAAMNEIFTFLGDKKRI